MARNQRPRKSPCGHLQILVVLVFKIQAGLSCPSVCVCGVQNDKIYIQCNKVNFTAIPSSVPVDTQTLYFSRTQISTLAVNAFQALPNLETIELSNNQIENITDGILSGLTKLESLKFLGNGIKRISDKAFQGLTNLTTLVLSNNKLQSLPSNLLRDLINLSTLNLNNNELQELPTNLIRNSPKLSGLYLTNNRIRTVSRDLLKNSRLYLLYLDNNEITTIEDGAFSSMTSTLMSLKLNNNKISSFPLEQLFNLSMLFEVRLNNNSITTLPAKTRVFFDKIKRPGVSIYLAGNPFVCTPDLQWLQNWTRDHDVIKDMSDVMCRTYDGKLHRVNDYDFNNIVTPRPLPTKATPVVMRTTTQPTITLTLTSVAKSTSVSLMPSEPLRVSSAASSESLSQSPSIVAPIETSSVIPMAASDAPRPSSTVSSESLSLSPAIVAPVMTSSVFPMAASETPRFLATLRPSPSSSGIIFISPLTTLTPHLTPSLTSNGSLLAPSTTSIVISMSTAQPTTTASILHTTHKKGKVDQKVLGKKEKIILATCVTAGLLAAIIFIAMYCFRKKVVKRNKTLDSRYDRVSGVI